MSRLSVEIVIYQPNPNPRLSELSETAPHKIQLLLKSLTKSKLCPVHLVQIMLSPYLMVQLTYVVLW
jgi:hypothetical protein